MNSSWRGLLALVFAAGCGKVEGSDATIGVTVTPDDVLVRQGEAIGLDVTVDRGAFAGAIAIELAAAPPGITAEPLTLDPEVSTGTLTVVVDATAAQGATTFDVAARTAAGTSATPLRILVGGEPGTLDLSFADAGRFLTAEAEGALVGRNVVVDDEGRIVATGYSVAAPRQALLVRLTDDGAIDPSFGADGIVRTAFGTGAEGTAVISVGEELVVGGVAGGSGGLDTDFGLFRHDAAGDPVASFDEDGAVTFDWGQGNGGTVHAVVAESDGSLIAIGRTQPAAGGVLTRAFRFSASGVRDATYDVAQDGFAQAGVLQADGKLVTVGSRDVQLWLGRYTTTGAPDLGFGSQGQVETNFPEGNVTGYGLALLPGGKLLAVGVIVIAVNDRRILLARYNANGSLDLTFGSGGSIITPIAFDSNATNAVVATDDALLLVGSLGDHPAVARLHFDGTADTTFGVDGVAQIDFERPTVPFASGGYGIALDVDARIVISAEVGAEGSQQLGIARLWP